MEPTSHGWSHRPVRNKKGRQETRDAATSQASGDLELEYANSLIRVIRSRKDNGARVQASARSAPTERSVLVAENVLLLSGCSTFNVSGHRAGAERLAPLASSTHRSLPTGINEGSNIKSHRSSIFIDNANRLADSPSHFAPAAFIFNHRQQSPAKRKPEASVLSALRSPPADQEQRRPASEEPGQYTGPARSTSENGGRSQPEKRLSAHGLETAVGPGVAHYKDGHVSSTVRLSPVSVQRRTRVEDD